MKNLRRGAHTVHDLKVHMVWATKYRKKALKGAIQERCRDLLLQIASANDIQVLKGVVSKDHVHMHVSYPPKMSISEMARRFKGRTGKILLTEYKETLKDTYWGGHFWSIGYGAWSSGNITDEMIDEYLDHHDNRNNDDSNFLLE